MIRSGIQYATEDAQDERASLGVERPVLQTVTKAEAVYLETRARILTGTLLPGLQVNQEALAGSLGLVSDRHPIRNKARNATNRRR